MNYTDLIDINKKTIRDLEYIKNDIIAEQEVTGKIFNEITGKMEKEKLYVKFSRIINAVTIINMPKKQYVNYYKTQYKDYPDKLESILQAIEEKFENNLISANEMLIKILRSNDVDSEKKAAIKNLIKYRGQK